MEKVRRGWNGYLILWKELRGWKLFFFYLIHYTALFFLLQKWVFSDFYETERSFVWTVDGLWSYFPRLSYISQTVRNGIQSLLNGGGWTIPLYDFRTIPAKTDLQVEPLQWLAVLWPWDQLDSLYDFLCMLRYYLAGLSFSILGFYLHFSPLPVLIGAVSYTFCGYSIYAGVRHPSFLAPMILLPLLIIGAEKVLKGERGWLFACIAFLSLISNLYLSCMIAILTVLYLLVRFFSDYAAGKRSIEFLKMLGRFALWGGVGILLSGVVTVPTLFQMTGTGRIGRDVGELLYYGPNYYQRLFTEFTLFQNEIIEFSGLGFSTLAIPAIILLGTERKRRRSLKILFILLTGIYLSPMAGYILSGFNNLNNRWSFAYALCICVIIMFEIPKLATDNRVILAVAGGGTVAYMGICYFLIDRKYYHEESLVFLLMTILLVSMCYAAGTSGKKVILPLCLVLTCLSVFCTAFQKYAPSTRDMAATNASKGQIYSTYEAGQYYSLSMCPLVQKDDGFFRVAASDLSEPESAMAFYYGLNGTSYYTSAVMNAYKELQRDMEIMERGQNIRGMGNDARGPLLSLLNVKYYAVRGGEAAYPYGFKEIDRIQNGKSTDIILRNECALPIGYTYGAYFSTEKYNKLVAVEKQEAMMQAAILDEKPNTIAIQEKSVEIRSQKIQAEIIGTDGVTWEDGTLKVSQEKATLTLGFQGLPRADTYLRVVNLDLTSGQSERRWNLVVNTENTSTYAMFIADGWLYNHGAKTQLLYLGNSSEGYTTCTLIFPEKGTFILDDLEIWCQPMDHYAEQIEALRAESLENVETNWRGLTGTISVSKDKFLCFSIPYDEGWTAYVDGEKANLLQANIGFMGVGLSAGDHDIELKYWPPGLTAGILLSCTGLIGVAGLIIYTRKIKRKGMAEK